MKIGIDIDNTLTEVQEKLNEAAYTYAVSLGKNLDGYDKLMQDEKNDGTEYGFWLMAGAMFKYPYIYDAIKELGYDKIE